MIRISKTIVEEIHKQGLQEAPYEACGYLAGLDDSLVRVFPMKNVDHSEEHFSLDPQEQFAVIKKVRQEALQLLAVYHTHPVSPARPSEEDIRLAYDPDIIYVIGSLAEKDFVVRAFNIKNGIVSPVPLEVI